MATNVHYTLHTLDGDICVSEHLCQVGVSCVLLDGVITQCWKERVNVLVYEATQCEASLASYCM